MREVPVIEPRRKGRAGTQSMLIPSLSMLSVKLSQLPAGQMSDLAMVRRSLAVEFGADACCPVTVQRHLVRLAESGEAPYWRAVDPDRPFAQRLAGGSAAIRDRLTREQQQERPS